MNNRLEALRASGTFIAPTVHYNRRSYDKQLEIVGRLTDERYLELELNAGQEVVLDVQPDRHKALDVVRFLRGQD